MQRVWRHFRYTVLGAAFVVLGVYLFAFTPWREKLGWLPAYREVIDPGEGLVEGLYRYHEQRGLWPEYLDDLSPEFLAARPAPIWNYEVTAAGPALATPAGSAHTSVGYDFDARVWRVAGLMDNRMLGAGPAAVPSTLPAGERLARQLSELDRRIAREPDEIDHWRAKVSLLRAAGRTDEALATIRAAQAKLPDHLWPRLAEAVIGDEAALAAFAAWVQGHPTFTHFDALALACRLRGDDAAALDALRAGLAQPLAVGDDDPHILAFYLFDETRYALRRGEWKLAIELADAWERAKIPQRDFLVLRAGAKLAGNDPAAAAADLATLDEGKAPAWAGNLAELRDAVARRDASFHYDPGDRPPPDPVFMLPP